MRGFFAVLKNVGDKIGDFFWNFRNFEDFQVFFLGHEGFSSQFSAVIIQIRDIGILFFGTNITVPLCFKIEISPIQILQTIIIVIFSAAEIQIFNEKNQFYGFFHLRGLSLTGSKHEFSTVWVGNAVLN